MPLVQSPLLAVALLAFGFCACTVPEGSRGAGELPEPAAYVGVEVCARCHQGETDLWRGSHHDLAMQEAREDTVLGSFNGTVFEHEGVTTKFFRRDGKFLVETEGPGGGSGEFEVAYVFGVEPLQQYLLALPRGRLQALTVAWDTRPKAESGQRWFHLYPDEVIAPDDPLHWTGRLQNWNLMCAECHSTALEKGYDFESDTYETTWSEIDVSCEACHGPGSRHALWGESEKAKRGADSGLVVDLSDRDGAVWVMDMTTGLSKREPPRQGRTEVETCARCHSRRSSQQADYVHGEPILDTHRVSLLDGALYYPDGQILDEVYVYGSFLQSKMYRKGVTCKDCHEPHGLHVRGEGNSVCAACHDVGRYDSRSHHFHEPGTKGASCIECHMPSRTYMVVDPRHDHSFRVPRPDLSASLGVPNACNDCHRANGNRSPKWAAETVVQWYGAERPHHYGEILDAGRRGLPGAGDRLARLASEPETPGIVRATSLEMLGSLPSRETPSVIQAGLADEDPLVRLGAVEGAVALDPAARHRLAVALLSDPVRGVRIEAARLLSEVPLEFFTTEQRRALDAALEEYRKAQRRNADWPESHMNLALVHLARGELPEARRAYENALRLDPSFTRAYVNLADLHRMEGRDAEGEALLRRGLSRSPEAAELHHALGLTLVRLHRNDEALESLRRAAGLHPGEARYAYVYGVALEGSGEVDAAIRVLDRALESHPYDREILHALAAFEEKRGRVASAVEYARRLVEASPGDPAAREILARLKSEAPR